MIIDIDTKAVCKIDIESSEAFRILCKTLHMNIVLDEETDYFIKKNLYDENCVYVTRNGHNECVDERGDLFVALRNVAVNMFPNALFRSANYIYK